MASANDCKGYWDPTDNTCMPYTETASTAKGVQACVAAGGQIVHEKVKADSQLAFYRGSHGAVWQYAPPGTDVSMCIFPDGSACREDMFQTGQCLSDTMEKTAVKWPAEGEVPLPEHASCPHLTEFDGTSCIGMSEGLTGVLTSQDPQCSEGVWSATERACVPVPPKSGGFMKTALLTLAGAAAVFGIGYLVVKSGDEPERAANPRRR